ncbi:class I SAM-dependent DNA methyltransferase [Ilumatobacter coccineus]|uniref:Putative methyltransferase n=1 Tax=Ilumatobacter coccineus (strain NBRC 103263 / KCTC 29153 / YM16-304) TaxID=1313172 RepID=A0A6C7E752_ILUCY|nr:class I SAM-dependent methyltransferase [Ilumatobacter coccineus]BAN02280.1 putative methyltransferase [Ilumatobacter coccineus YM16-304]
MDDHLRAPDEHLDPAVAATYDDAVAARFHPDEVGPTVDRLVELADDATAVEFAIGTGRIALPLADRGVTVRGIDLSEPMLDRLRAKAGSDRVEVTVGDMTSVQLGVKTSLVYLVFNTIMNLRTQHEQVGCFRNAVRHLAPGGRFVVETIVPRFDRLGTHVFDLSDDHVGIDEYVDPVGQISISHHFVRDADGRHRKRSAAFRYAWPSELDLMAQIAGLTLEHRWADWHRSPFTADSTAHVSVWRLLVR